MRHPQFKQQRTLQQIGLVTIWISCLVVALAWQWQGRAVQHVDIGSPLDDGYVFDAQASEQSATADLDTFRWTSTKSTVRLWPLLAQTPTLITLRLAAPPPQRSPHTAYVVIDNQYSARIILDAAPKVYTFLVAPTQHDEATILLYSTTATAPSDPRALGVVIDTVAATVLGTSALGDLLRELWAAPFLPLGVVLIGLAGLLLRAPPLVGLVPPAVLGTLFGLDQVVPDAQLLLASYGSGGMLLVSAGAASVWAVRRLPPLAPTTDQRAQWWLVGVFLLAFVLAFVPTVQSDGTGYYAYLHSLVIDGDLNFGNEYGDMPFRHTPSPQERLVAETGYYANPYSIGPALLWMPLYVVAHLLTLAVGGMFGWQANGYDLPYVVAVGFTSALAGFVTLLAVYRICRRWVTPPVALLATVTAVFGSNLAYYALREGSFAHALSAATVALYLLAWLRLDDRPTLRRWLVLGAAAGVMIVVYWISAILLLLPALTFGRLLVAHLRAAPGQCWPRLRHLVTGSLLAATVCVLVFSPQMLAWHTIFGSFLTIPQGNSFVSPGGSQWRDFLFSPLHGLLPWTPAFFVGMLGLLLLWRRGVWLACALTLPFLVFFWYNTTLSDWHGSGAFGLRRLTVLTPWFALGLALLFDKLRRWRSESALGLALLLIGWVTMLTVRYDLRLIPHDVGALAQMSPLTFYLSRDVFPLWAVQGWLRSSLVLGNTLVPRAPLDLLGFAALGMPMLLVLAGSMAVWRFWWRA